MEIVFLLGVWTIIILVLREYLHDDEDDNA